jgi:hypothetical protein
MLRVDEKLEGHSSGWVNSGGIFSCTSLGLQMAVGAKVVGLRWSREGCLVISRRFVARECKTVELYSLFTTRWHLVVAGRVKQAGHCRGS